KPMQKLNFGRVAVGRQRARWIRVFNRGGGTLNVTWSSHPSAEFETSYGGTSINAGQSFKFKFFFAPLDRGRVEVPLTFTTNDPQRPSVTITLVGTGYFRR